MRLSWAVLTSQTIILMLTGLTIGMEVIAFINDMYWNAMVDDKSKRFTEKEFSECKVYDVNESLIEHNTQAYNNVFKAKKRDLPFELPFLGLICFSFAMYFILINIYIGWKKVMPNIYICIVSNFLGTISHMVSFGLILASTLMYSDPELNYMGSPGCYAYVCKGPDCSSGDSKMVRGKALHDEGRACLEKLHICQLSGFKDRTVYLLLGCIISSMVALYSSISRLRRHKNRRIQPKKTFIQIPDNSNLHPSLESGLRRSIPQTGDISDETVTNVTL